MDHPSLEIRAEVGAQSIRFGHVPSVVTQSEGEWASDSERENLPDVVRPRVTYRQVRVRWDVRAHLAASPGSPGRTP